MNSRKEWFFKLVSKPYGLGICIFILLFIISLFPSMGIDEGVWSYIGTVWSKFAIPPLKGALDDKASGIHIIYAVSNYLFGVNVWFPRLLGCIALTWSAFIVYSVVNKLRDNFAGLIAMLIFGLSMSWQFTDGSFPAQTESFMVFFNLLALKKLLDIYFDNPKRSITKLTLCGFFIGCAMSFKQIALFNGIAVCIIYFLIAKRNNLCKKNCLSDFLFIALGCFTALVLFFIPLLLSGVSFSQYFEAAWWNILSMFLSQSGSAASIPVRINGFLSSWIFSKLLLFYPLIIICFVYRSAFKDKFFISYGLFLVMLFDFLSVNAVGYYWSHHFKQIVPSFSIISGLGVSVILEKLSDKRHAAAKFLPIFLFIVITFLCFPYSTFINGIMSPKTDYPDKLGEIIKKNTSEDDYVYVFSTLDYGYGMVVQAYSERRSPTKYFAPFSLYFKGTVKRISRDIVKKNTRIVVVPLAIQHRIPEAISDVISKYYKKKTEKFNFAVYEKIY